MHLCLLQWFYKTGLSAFILHQEIINNDKKICEKKESMTPVKELHTKNQAAAESLSGCIWPLACPLHPTEIVLTGLDIEKVRNIFNKNLG